MYNLQWNFKDCNKKNPILDFFFFKKKEQNAPIKLKSYKQITKVLQVYAFLFTIAIYKYNEPGQLQCSKLQHNESFINDTRFLVHELWMENF